MDSLLAALYQRPIWLDGYDLVCTDVAGYDEVKISQLAEEMADVARQATSARRR